MIDTPPRRSSLLKRLLILLAGAGLVILGVLLIPLPGPGLLTMVAGVAVWATEFSWAKRWYQYLKSKISDTIKKPQP